MLTGQNSDRSAPTTVWIALDRTKCRLKAMCGQEVRTLGLKDAQALGIVKINLEGQQLDETESVRQLYDMPRQAPGPGIISGGQTQEEIDLQMTELVRPFQQVFQGIGAAKVEPVHIEVDKTAKPVQQMRRPIATTFFNENSCKK